MTEADRIVTRLENSARAAGKQLLGTQNCRHARPAQIGLAGAVPGHLPEAHPFDLGHVVLRLHGCERHDYVAADAIPPNLQPAAGNKHPLRVLHVGRQVSSRQSSARCLIDKVGRKRWYTGALLIAPLPLILLAWLGATSPMQVLVLAGLALCNCADCHLLALSVLG